jgi:hypothetical protein
MEQQQQQQRHGGVQPGVFAAVMDLEDDTDDPTRRWLVIHRSDFTDVNLISQHDAFFLVATLEAIVLEELATAATAAVDSNNTNNIRTTGLYLDRSCLSEQAMAVFSDYFQQEDIYLQALYLYRPNDVALLLALHNNTSIKHLCIHGDLYEKGDDDSMGHCIGQLLQNKNDHFESLHFVRVGGHDSFSMITLALPFLRGKHPHLKRLALTKCGLDKSDSEMALEPCCKVTIPTCEC